LTSGTELILIGWKIVPNEENVQCDHRFASQPLENEPCIRHKSSESARHNFTMWALSCATFSGLHFLASFGDLWGLILYQMSNVFVIIKMCYVHNQWY